MSSVLSVPSAEPVESAAPTWTVAGCTPAAMLVKFAAPSSMTDAVWDLGISGVARSRTYLSNAVASSNSARLVGILVSSRWPHGYEGLRGAPLRIDSKYGIEDAGVIRFLRCTPIAVDVPGEKDRSRDAVVRPPRQPRAAEL